jgi:two-component sensor histidine kinase
MPSLRLNIILLFILCPGIVSAQTSSNIVNKYALEADSINLQARKFMLWGKRDSAISLLNKALELSHKSGNSTIIARCYIDFASLYLMQGKYSNAQQYLEQAWPYLEKTDHYDVKITGIMQRANLYNVIDKKDSSIYYYRMAEKYNTEKMPYRNWVVYMALGELFNQTDDLDEANKNFLKAYQLTSQKENKPDHGYLLTVFINFYVSHNKAEGAGSLISEYNQLMEERKRKKFVDPLHNVMMNMTNNKLEDNVEFMKAVKSSCLKEGQILQAIVANGYIVTYYEKRKKFDAAIDYATEGELLAGKTGGVQNIYGAKKIKYGLLQKAGKYREANEVAESLFTLKDSMLALQKREQLYELEKKFETEKKEKEIALLMSDKKMASLELQQQIFQRNALTMENMLMDSIVKSEQAYSMSLTKEKEKETALNAALERENALKAGELVKEKKLSQVLIGGTILFMLAAAIILFQYKRQRAKKMVIQKQADELQVLMKEIHHRVKNNLQVISSLLDLQSLTIEDIQASEAVKEGKNRVQSMALIHQNLYSEGNIKGIKAKEYIDNLLQSLCDSYNITSDKVKVNTQIDELNLDVDTMIPLGLVLNELVSNSFKYAFRDGRNGELNVVLKEEQQHLFLKVSDNGTGYPEGMKVKEVKSFGMKMIRAFAQKLKAKLDIYNNNGAVVEMQITKYNMA